MGFRQLGIPRRRLVRRVLQSTEQLVGSNLFLHLFPPFSTPAAGLQPSPYLRLGLRQQQFWSLSTLVDRLLNEGKRDECSIREGDATPSLPSRAVLVQESNLFRSFPVTHKGWRQDEFRRWGEGPEGSRWLTTYSRILQESARASTSSARAEAVQYSGDEDDDDRKAKKEKEKEASPDDCDQAVEGLSSLKAKMKQAEKEASKKNEGWMVKTRNAISGIGPAMKAIASMSRQDWATKIQGWKKSFWLELQHYWVGTKLLWADVKISSRLLLRLASGRNLTRRERQQLTRTTADIFRLVPFAVFILVPFMEFLLPIALKLFPNMLPSTFQDKMKKQEEMKKRLNARMQYAKFLQDTVGEMAKELKTSRSGELRRTAENLDDFMSKVRTGGNVQNEEILRFAKLFNDELTLDNISRPRLVSMCKYMGIQPYGTDAYLRYSLRTKLAWIKQDDRMIRSEGLDSLSESELRAACRERGMLGLLSAEEMRLQLTDWLDLSLNHSVPSSLLILSRAFIVAGRLRPEEAVQATLSSLPDEVIDSVGHATLPSEEALEERKRKLEYLQQEEELIKEEEENQEKRKKVAEGSDEKDQALQEIILATAREAQELAKTKSVDKREDLCKLSGALAVLASASSVSKERGEFLRLVQNEIVLYNNMVDKEGTPDAEKARKAYRAAREHSHQQSETSPDHVSSALIERVDAMLHKLEKELDDVDVKIGDRWRMLDRDYDGKVTPEEVAAAAMYLKDSLDKESIHELISNLAKDADGKILVQDIVKLGTMSEAAEGDIDEIANKPQHLA